jgi:hypothetical protein
MAKRPEERLASMTLVREHLRVWFDPRALGTIRSTTLASQAENTAEIDEPVEVRPLTADSGRLRKAQKARAKPAIATLNEASSQTWRRLAVGGAIAIGLAILGLSALYKLTH